MMLCCSDVITIKWVLLEPMSLECPLTAGMSPGSWQT